MDGRKFDPKDAAIEGFYTVKALFEQLLDDFRSRDRYFKYKVAIIGAWLAISAGTLGISCAGGPHENSLHAVTEVTHVLDDSTLLIRNDSSTDWSDVRLQLNGKFNAYVPTILAGGNFVIAVKQFVGSDGQMPAPDMKPRTLTIRCHGGHDTLDLTKPEGAQ